MMLFKKWVNEEVAFTLTSMVSIVIPTKNSSSTLEKCLSSIKNIDYSKDKIEVIIVDGYSTDNTVEIAKRYGCKIIFEDKQVISYARDIGFRHAKGDFIAFTDADCVVDKKWIKELMKHFNENVAAVGGPNITPEDDTEFAKRVGIVLSFLSKAGARYGLIGGEVREVHHNPTCNVMYRKRVLEEVGGFNCKLITVDDEELDYRIRKKGYKIMYTPYAIVYHYRKPTWKKFIKMAYTYGLGRMQAIKLHKDMGRWFHFLPSLVILIISVLLLLSFINNIFLWSAIAMLSVGSIITFISSVYLCVKYNKKKDSVITFFLLIIAWVLFWGIGFIRGAFK